MLSLEASSLFDPSRIPDPCPLLRASLREACHATLSCMMNSSHSLVVFDPCSPVSVMTARTSGVNCEASRKGVLNADGCRGNFVMMVGI
jgi:hypothetical protein